MQLLQHNGDADAREHGMDHHRCDGQRDAAHPCQSEQCLEHAGCRGDGAGDGPAELFDQAGNDHGQSGGGSTDLQRGTTQAAGDDPAHGGGDQAGHDRGAGGGRDSQRQRDGHQEHHQRRRQVPAEPGGQEFPKAAGILTSGVLA
ncbi:hypothetical protein D9M72_516600 [compost metagenome]